MTAALALLALAQAADDPDDLVSLALRYLARHQAGHGSWGLRPPRCACADEPAPPLEPLDEAGRARVRALVDELDADELERRHRAQEDLVRTGWPAEPVLREARGGPEARARVSDVLRRIARTGTREDVELSAWALLAFLGAGYSHLSKDEHDGITFGDVVRRGLAWLTSARAEDESARALVALALSEAYGLTASKPLEAPAQKAIDGVAAAPARSERALAWEVMALKSAEISGLAFPRRACEDRLAELKRRRSASPDAAFLQASEAMAWISIKKSRDVDLGRLPRIDPAKEDVETAYLASLALFQYDGPSGGTWRAWAEVQKRWLVPAQMKESGRCARGAWPAAGTAARLKFACHGALMNEIYYAYAVQK